MGIQSLLPFLANSTRDAHISEFENEFVAIDAYCWLHKSIYCCAFELAMKVPTVKYVTYCMRYIEMLLHFNVKPILVFDGRQLSSKSETERKRRDERRRKYARGKELLKAGKTLEGRKLIGESVDVTHELALQLIKECRKKNIDCIVAPFEADAQLCFLSVKSIVKCVITEDSDLLAYGTERVMFKMDTCGRGKLIEKSEIYRSLKMDPAEFSEDIFRYMCILSGCDYLPSLPSIGPVNALKFVKMLKGNNIYDVLPKLPIYLNKLNITVTPEYREGFKTADNTFKHQLVYNPLLRSQVPLLPTENEDDIVGTKLPDDVAFNLALGNIDPITMKEVDNYDPDKTGRGFLILWKKKSLPRDTEKHAKNPILTARRRQRESPETDAVQTTTNDLKKQRTLKVPTVQKSKADCDKKIPECGFIFYPKSVVEKRNVSNIPDESILLKSRYFLWAKGKREEKKPTGSVSDRRKDESHEEYLQRLCNEFFPADENESDNCDRKKNSIDPALELENDVLEKCVGCRKYQIFCICVNEDDSCSQKLGESNRKSEEVAKGRENSSSQHFLLDVIYKSEMEKSESLSKNKKKWEEEKPKKVSPSESLSMNFSKILSKITETPKSRLEAENSKGATPVEKENAEVIFTEEPNSDRSPSPVFRVQREAKVLKRSCRFGNLSDTAGTLTSVYFSHSSSSTLNVSNPQVSSGSTPDHRKTPSLKSSNSVPCKTGRNKTLFQFGFKKQCRNENESNT